MPELSVAEFSSVVVTTGQPKKTKIRKLVMREPYQHFRDYYLPLRREINSLFIKRQHISHLYDIARNQKDSRKKVNYEKVVNVFKGWQSGKNITAYTPVKETYQYSSTVINCNPELNVILNGQPRLVKLHFSTSEKMTQIRANIICSLIAESVGDDGFQYSVLDLTTGDEFFFSGDHNKTIDSINSEIEDLEKIWSEFS